MHKVGRLAGGRNWSLDCSLQMDEPCRLLLPSHNLLCLSSLLIRRCPSAFLSSPSQVVRRWSSQWTQLLVDRRSYLSSILAAISKSDRMQVGREITFRPAPSAIRARIGPHYASSRRACTHSFRSSSAMRWRAAAEHVGAGAEVGRGLSERLRRRGGSRAERADWQ